MSFPHSTLFLIITTLCFLCHFSLSSSLLNPTAISGPPNLAGNYTSFNSNNGQNPFYDLWIATQNGYNVIFHCANWCAPDDNATIDQDGIHITIDKGTYTIAGIIKMNATTSECGWVLNGPGGGTEPRGPTNNSTCIAIEWLGAQTFVQIPIFPWPITKVHVIYTNHIQMGTTSIVPSTSLPPYINTILNIYFLDFFPRITYMMNTLNDLNVSSNYNYTYTTHAWLVDLYLNCPPNLILNGIKLLCPTADEKIAFQNLVQSGAITWQRGAFDFQPEILDSTFFQTTLTVSNNLDKVFNLTSNKITLSNRNIPGLTRSMIPLLKANKLEAITIGVNQETCPPLVPKIFLWKDLNSNSDIITMLHPGGYPLPPEQGGISPGDCVTIEGYNEALCWAFRDSNQGPSSSINEIISNIKIIQSLFPNSTIIGSTYDNFITNLLPYKSLLPIITSEIGDSWIQGTQSDPLKIATQRALIRSFSNCLNSKKCDPSDPLIMNVTRWLLKPVEQSWGFYELTTPSSLAPWDNNGFQQARQTQAGFQQIENSWIEQRYFQQLTLDTLQQQQNPLYNDMMNALQELKPIYPDPNQTGFVPVTPFDQTFTCAGMNLAFDATGAIVQLDNLVTGMKWANGNLGNYLGQLSYQTFDETTGYNITQYQCNNVLGGKPGSNDAKPVTQTWNTKIVSLYQRKIDVSNCSFLMKLSFPDVTVTQYGGATDIWVQIDASNATIGNNNLQLNFTLQLFNKTSTRLAEAMFMNFKPVLQKNFQWGIDKLGSIVDPLDVVDGGSQYAHGTWDGVKYFSSTDFSQKSLEKANSKEEEKNSFSMLKDTSINGLWVSSLDVGVVSPITTNYQSNVLVQDPLPLKIQGEDILGFGFNLHNNLWNKNYILYYPYKNDDKDIKYRWSLVVS